MKTCQTCLVAFLGARQNESQNTRVVNKLTLATGRTAQLPLPHIRAFVNNAQKEVKLHNFSKTHCFEAAASK